MLRAAAAAHPTARRAAVFAAAAWLALARSPVPAQAQRADAAASLPRFETSFNLARSRPLEGRQVVRVGRATVAGKPGVLIGVRVLGAGRTLVLDSVPGSVFWDTRSLPDGVQTLQLVLLDTVSGRAEVCDTLRVVVRNGRSVTSALLPPPPKADAVRASLLTAISTTSAAPRTGTPSRTRRAARSPELPERITAAPVEATATDPDRPLTAPATALARAGDRVFLGLTDGGIALCDTDGHRGRAVHPKDASGPVRALTASVDGRAVFWLTAGRDRLYCYRDSDRRVTAFDVQDAGGSGPWVERLAFAGGKVALLGEGAAWFLDPADGTLQSAASVLPPAVAERGARLFLAADAGCDVLAATVAADDARRNSVVRVWSAPRLSADAADWSERGELATRAGFGSALASADGPLGRGDAHAAPAGRASAGPAPLALTPHGYALIEGDAGRVSAVQVGLAGSPDGAPPFSPRPLPVALEGNPAGPQRPGRVAFGRSGVWWEEGGIVQRTDPLTGRREAYLPWNGAGIGVRSLVADGESLWVATDKGVRRIRPGRPTEEDGYGGYVRVLLGAEAARPSSERDARLAGLVEEWQGAPYKWGGQAKTGTDCSGFVMSVHQAVGVALPRTSKAMGATAQGRRVRDELRYGDVLVFPGHVALYIGNGRTAETVGGSNGQSGGVGKASIWRRREVIVKRFLP